MIMPIAALPLKLIWNSSNINRLGFIWSEIELPDGLLPTWIFLRLIIRFTDSAMHCSFIEIHNVLFNEEYHFFGLLRFQIWQLKQSQRLWTKVADNGIWLRIKYYKPYFGHFWVILDKIPTCLHKHAPRSQNARPRVQMCAWALKCPSMCPNARPGAKMPAHMPKHSPSHLGALGTKFKGTWYQKN